MKRLSIILLILLMPTTVWAWQRYPPSRWWGYGYAGYPYSVFPYYSYTPLQQTQIDLYNMRSQAYSPPGGYGVFQPIYGLRLIPSGPVGSACPPTDSSYIGRRDIDPKYTGGKDGC